ncbi:hypothetical protein O181_070919 [Austropuccinia psidii MF-1]|uniref:Uncharacterized protein n=1 Tax=Austropuccinia psidii MF-1 TaxID=1389203 RepID=A0A9Q3IA00_9BASI|nr:hypothetical protein [Austropuccinia psidii MF-1]
MNHILTVFSGSSIFSKIDLCGSYELLRIKEVDEHLKAFRTKYATLLDALSCQDDVYPERGEDLIRNNPINFQQLIKKDEVQPSKFFAVRVDSCSNLIYSINKALWKDSQDRSILQDWGKGKSFEDYSLDPSSQLPLFEDWVVVPSDPTIKLSILQNPLAPPYLATLSKRRL